jgi:hypothetical protein
MLISSWQNLKGVSQASTFCVLPRAVLLMHKELRRLPNQCQKQQTIQRAGHQDIHGEQHRT